jgi:iron complex transport system substrate-binding protein
MISSGTEILYALGLKDMLVGISHECDYPPEIRHLPVVSEPKIDPTKSGREIDRDVRSIVREGLSVYRIKTEVLRELAPDLIVTQDQCAVCAVSLKDVEEAVCSLTLKKTRVCSLTPHVLDDIVLDFYRVAEAAEVRERADEMKREFWIRLNRVNSRIDPKRKPRIALLEWLQPPIIAGGWMPELARLAGTQPVLVESAEKFKKVTWPGIEAAQPEIVLILPCGYPTQKTWDELMDPGTSSALRRLAAVRNGQCYVLDGNAYFNRPGPRIADSTEILAAVCHPTRYPEFLEKYQVGIRAWK